MNDAVPPKGRESAHMEELDLVIHNMEGETAELAVGKILKVIPGIESARIVNAGVWLRYDPARISKEEICQVLHQSGFRAGVFQDSLSGKTGTAS